MEYNTYTHNDYYVIQIDQESFEENDCNEIKNMVKNLLSDNQQKIAISCPADLYPYSKLISAFVQCQKVVSEKNGNFAIIHPGSEIVEMLKALNLDKIIRLFSSKNDI